MIPLVPLGLCGRCCMEFSLHPATPVQYLESGETPRTIPWFPTDEMIKEVSIGGAIFKRFDDSILMLFAIAIYRGETVCLDHLRHLNAFPFRSQRSWER